MVTPQTLPAPRQLRRLMQSLAALDAIYSPEWQYRYYSFNSNWSDHEEMGSIRNGSGDNFFVLFNSEGCFIKGWSHEFANAEKTKDDFYAKIPEDFIEASREPAFSPELVSFCNWRQMDDSEWKGAVDKATLDQNVFFLLEGLDGDPKTYQAFTADYHEIEADLESISSVYKHEPMTRARAEAMNREIDYGLLVESLKEIDYPIVLELTPENSDARKKPKGFFKRLFGER